MAGQPLSPGPLIGTTDVVAVVGGDDVGVAGDGGLGVGDSVGDGVGVANASPVTGSTST